MRILSLIIVAAASLILMNNTVLALDRDHDGIDDTRDRCPDTASIRKLPGNFIYRAAVNPVRLQPGIKAHPVKPDGCEPDRDGDGVVDSQDYCPDDAPNALVKGVAKNGCPRQSDGDGTPDYRDKCPNTPRGTKTDQHGCEVRT